jgi:CheY-like chemotaxis protein
MATVSVIDDSAEMRRVPLRLLESAGHHPYSAVDGADGVALFERHRPDLVISDILMPNKEGIETIRELRRIAPAVKILAISGSGGLGGPSYLAAARELGADEVLAKPVRAVEFYAVLNRLLGLALAIKAT